MASKNVAEKVKESRKFTFSHFPDENKENTGSGGIASVACALDENGIAKHFPCRISNTEFRCKFQENLLRNENRFLDENGGTTYSVPLQTDAPFS